MRRIGYYATAAAAGALLIVAVRCATMNPANTSEVGNPKLSGHLVDGRTDIPADNATVRLYQVYLNKTAQALGKTASGAPAIDSTRTDHNGFYQFDSLDQGIYSIEAEKIDGADTLTMRHPSVVYISSKDLGYDTLQLPGSIKGKVVVPGGESPMGITCYIPGTSYIAITSDTGGFRITGIPAGTYSLSFSSTRFNDTTLYNKTVSPAAETDIGSVTLGFDMSKNVHDVWGVFDTTADYTKVHRIEARLSGDSIPADSPRVYSLDWRPDVAGYSGFIYLPTEGLFWKVAVWVYDSQDHRIGAFEIPINRVTGDIQFPSFNPCNGIPRIDLCDTTVSLYDSVPLHSIITKLADDSMVSMAWDIGNTGTFTPTTATDTLIIAPGDSAEIPCVFRATDRFGNVAGRTALVTVVKDPPMANAGNDTTVNTNDSFSVHYSGSDGYGRIVKYRFDVNGDGVFEDSSTISGDKRFKASPTGGNFPIILQVEDDDRNRSDDTMIVHVVFHGIVAYWSFDSVSGSTYFDVTGHGYDAISTGTNIGIASGIRGNALSCTGSGFDCSVTNSKNDFCLNTFTIESWYYPNTIQSSGQRKILTFDSIKTAVGNGYNICVVENGFVSMSIWSSVTNYWAIATSTTALVANKWYHIVGTYDGSYLRTYVNGVLESTVSITGGVLYPVDANARIGCEETGDRGVIYNADGKIDELKLYNYALSADSIAAHYNNP